MDKAKELYLQLEQASDAKKRIDLTYLLAYEFMNTDLHRMEELLHQAVTEARKINYKQGIAEYYNGMGRLYYKRTDFNRAYELFTQAYDLAGELGDTAMQGMISDSLGMTWWVRSEYEKALEYSMRGLKLLQQTPGEKVGSASCLNNIGNCYERMGNAEKAEEYYRKSLTILEDNGHKMATIVRGNMAVMLSKQGKIKESIVAYKMCLEDFRRSNHRNGEANTHNNLASAYVVLGDYASALRHCQRAVKILKGIDNRKALAETYRALGETHLGFDAYKEALKYLNMGLKLHIEIGDVNGECLALSAIAEVYLKNNKTMEAIGALEQAYELAEANGIGSELARVKPLLYQAYTQAGDNGKAAEYLD